MLLNTEFNSSQLGAYYIQNISVLQRGGQTYLMTEEGSYRVATCYKVRKRYVGFSMFFVLISFPFFILARVVPTCFLSISKPRGKFTVLTGVLQIICSNMNYCKRITIFQIILA